MTLTFGSLFAGVGGFDMGFEQAGWDCKFQVEWDKNCQQILNKHWPDVPKWLDVSDVNGAEIPPVDCIIFGSPCQDLSVAGKRAGLEGERSGLFHEAVRIIKEMRDATNGTFPRWTVWENVAGALSSNNGRDFGTVINEMAKAGAHLQEYALLDAQHFGIPQRRRRVFLVSCFDSATADRCPDPLLPVTESLRGDTKKGKPKGKSAALTLTEGIGGDGAIVNAIGASIYHKSTVVNQDVNCGHLVTEGGILGSDIVGPLNTSDAKMISNQYVNENKCVVEPMLLDGTRVDDVRVYEPPVQTLKERMGTGGNNVPMLAFDTQFGSNANVTEDIAPTLKSSQQSPSVAYPIQDGREIEKHQNGFGVASDGEPSYTLDQTGAQAVAYSVREDAKANTFSATELDHANALSALRPSPQSHHAQMFIAEQVSFYDGYNQKLDDSGIHRSLRIGRDSSDFVAQPAEPTMAVRRLTPLECERLMGWPDDHTRYKADGTEQADTHRYRQCGNGVASPVAQWVAEQIRKVEYAEG
jgi:DNA (cytosine-5)-methyltransferase 1